MGLLNLLNVNSPDNRVEVCFTRQQSGSLNHQTIQQCCNSRAQFSALLQSSSLHSSVHKCTGLSLLYASEITIFPLVYYSSLVPCKALSCCYPCFDLKLMQSCYGRILSIFGSLPGSACLRACIISDWVIDCPLSTVTLPASLSALSFPITHG